MPRSRHEEIKAKVLGRVVKEVTEVIVSGGVSDTPAVIAGIIRRDFSNVPTFTPAQRAAALDSIILKEVSHGVASLLRVQSGCNAYTGTYDISVGQVRLTLNEGARKFIDYGTPAPTKRSVGRAGPY